MNTPIFHGGNWFNPPFSPWFPHGRTAKDWWIASHLHLDGSMKAVLSALSVTAVAFVVIFGLDKVAEPWRPRRAGKPWLVMAGLVMGVPVVCQFLWGFWLGLMEFTVLSLGYMIITLQFFNVNIFCGISFFRKSDEHG